MNYAIILGTPGLCSQVFLKNANCITEIEYKIGKDSAI